MALGAILYGKLEPLLRDYLSTDEEEEAIELTRSLRRARLRGYLTPTELEAICYWKSPRAIRHIRSNSAEEIRAATRIALRTRSERRRLDALTRLTGVSVPMASAVLTLLDPNRYGVIDIRVWQLLHRIGAVTKNAGATGFTFKNWYQFLMIIRHFAQKFRVKARDVERTLFLAHKKYQRGRLYGDRGQ
jgi:hypothetical protein